MGSQDGLTRHLKVRHKCQECENLSVREPLAPAAPHLSCWCDFPAGKGRLEQSPPLQGHPQQMARHPFGSHLPGDGGHGSGGSRWPQSRSALLQRLLLFREAKAALTCRIQWDFPPSFPSISKFSSKVKPPE